MRDTLSGKTESNDRTNTIWTQDDYEGMAGGIRDGLELDALADLLGRTPNAISGRAKYMIDPEVERGPGESAMGLLRGLLRDDPAYDWEAHVRRVSEEEGWHYWSRDELAALAQHWEDGTSLAELVPRFNLTETQLTDFLIRRRRLARSTIEVVERLGCAPGGQLETRYRLAVDRARAEVWVLVMSGLPGKRGTHISLHGAAEAAEAQRNAIVDALACEAVGSGDASVWWCIARRVPGYADGAPMAEGEYAIEA